MQHIYIYDHLIINQDVYIHDHMCNACYFM